ncbi:MAG: M15 family peptidase [Methylococcaceae bacterium]|nr:M15 family peptidase [Methylococcaceae bacterium]
MKEDKIKVIQQYLSDKELYSAAIDGDAGSGTMKATESFLESQDDELNDGWKRWEQDRKLVACIQLICKLQEIETGVIDGRWGQQTDYAYESYLYWLKNNEMPPLFRDKEEAVEETTRDVAAEPAKRTSSPTIIGSAPQWPAAGESALRRYYGQPGSNLTYLRVPYAHSLAWDTSTKVSRIKCHEKVHDSLDRVLNRVLDHYGEEKIKELHLDLFGGCFNKRKMRGGSRWSLHSWAIALDYDPSHNQLRWGRDKAAFARPEYEQWWKLWEEEGWSSLGRKKNYDWMHIQATK